MTIKKAAEKSKEKQRRGKPFKKGQSGNLSGRPKGLQREFPALYYC